MQLAKIPDLQYQMSSRQQREVMQCPVQGRKPSAFSSDSEKASSDEADSDKARNEEPNSDEEDAPQRPVPVLKRQPLQKRGRRNVVSFADCKRAPASHTRFLRNTLKLLSE